MEKTVQPYNTLLILCDTNPTGLVNTRVWWLFPPVRFSYPCLAVMMYHTCVALF